MTDIRFCDRCQELLPDYCTCPRPAAVDEAVRLVRSGQLTHAGAAEVTRLPVAAVTDAVATSRNDTSDTSDAVPVVTGEVDLLAGIRSGSWLDAQTFPPLRYAVPGLIPEGFGILIGPPKAGKSWLILGTLLGMAAGGWVLGYIHAERPRRVLYLALEDGDRRMQDRCRALLGEGQPIPPLFHYITAVQPGRVLDLIRAFLDRYPDTALVVIDTLGKVMPQAAPGESAYQRDYRVGGALKRIADQRPGLALVVLHHDRKAGSEDFVDSVSGTHGLAGSADTIVVLARKRQSTEGLLKVTGRDVPEGEYALQLADGVSWQLDGINLTAAAARAQQREDTAALSDTTVQIIEYVRSVGTASTGEVVERFGDNARKYLTRLADSGRLTKQARGRYSVPTPVTSVTSSFTQLSAGVGSDSGPEESA